MLRAIFGLALAGALGAASDGPPMPRPAPPPRTGGRAAANAGCVGCHEPVAREWADSLHRVSASDEPYVKAFEREPLRFCSKCHVPEAMPGKPASAWAEEVGVGCVTCHVTQAGAVLAAPGEGKAGPHAVTRSEAFAGPGACAACHTFGFPDAALRDRPTAMQATNEEHAGSWASAYACADCHMPWVEDANGGHRSHTFAASRDPAMLARAVGVAARRVSATEVEVTLTPGAAGHAFPTGDLFRRLELRVSLEGAVGRSETLTARLGRTFASRPQSTGVTVRDEIEDTRVKDTPVILRFDMTEATDHRAGICEDVSRLPVAWELRYQRVAFPDPRRRTGAALDGEVIVAFGVLPGEE